MPRRWLLLALTSALLAGGLWTLGAAQQPPPPATSAVPAPASPPTTGSETVSVLATDPALDEPTDHEKAGRCVEGSEQACMALSRQGKDGKERKILVVRTGVSDATGIYTICGPRENDPEDTPNIGVFSETGAGGIRIIIDKNVIRVPLATVTQKPPKDGQDGSDGSVEASAGTAKYLDTVSEAAKDRLLLCGVAAEAKPAPDTVFVTQGRTHLRGQKLVYDETDGVARIDGPVSFERSSDKDPLSGKSERIEVNVDEEKTVLVGNVVLQSQGGRVSKAGRVEYDDTKNQARLYGTADAPAQSTKGTDVISVSDGSILYNLDTSDVVVAKTAKGNITGEFKDGE